MTETHVQNVIAWYVNFSERSHETVPQLFAEKFHFEDALLVTSDIQVLKKYLGSMLRVLKNPKIEVIYNSTVVDLIGDQNTNLTGIKIKNVQTGETKDLETAALFYAIGHTPNTELFKGILDMDENGYLITAPESTVTKVPGVFACGDVRDHVYRQAVTAAGNGCMAAIEVERYLASKE